MKIRSPAKLEEVVLPKRKKNLADFILWMSTSNEAFRLVQKFTNIVPVILFGAGTAFSFLKGWVEAGVVSGIFFVWAVYNLVKKWPMMFMESGASMAMLSGASKYDETYEEATKDHWEEALKSEGRK